MDTNAPARTAPRFWPQFVVPAVLVPLLWVLLEGLAVPDGVITFYVVSIGAIPIATAAVLLPGWRLARDAWRSARHWLVPVVVLLTLPTIVIVLWGINTAVWLGFLTITWDF